MPFVTFNGPEWSVRVSATQRRLLRGEATEVSDEEAQILADSDADVTVHKGKPKDA